ncbi:MAG: AAA family ATPase [Pseudomonadota bacterium]
MTDSKTDYSDLDLPEDPEFDMDDIDKPLGRSFADALSDEAYDVADETDLLADLGDDLDAETSEFDAIEDALGVSDGSDGSSATETGSFADGLLAELEAEVAAGAREVGETSSSDFDYEPPEASDLEPSDPPPLAAEIDADADETLATEDDLEFGADAPPAPEESDFETPNDLPEDLPDDPPMDAAASGLGFDYDFGDAAAGDRPVPRISIHAYCQRPATQTLLQASGRDRRMSNASLEVLTGGVAAAVERYTVETTPNLIIVECTSDAQTVLAELDMLAEHCDEGVKVIVIGLANDIRLYRELMRRGVSEYLVPPLEPVQLIRAISSLFVDPDQPFFGRTIAVCGVKGGGGASTLAHNFAWAVSERLQQNATLIDLDLNFGTTGLDFNEEGAQSVADALLSPERFDEAVLDRLITKATERLSLFTAPATLDRTYDFDPDVYSAVLEQVRKSVPFVVMDMPHIWSDWFKGTIVSADDIIIVAGPDLASLRNGKNLIDFLKAARPNDNAPHLVLNMVGMPKRPEIPVKDFAQAIDTEPSLVMPFDPQLFGTAANNGQMIADVSVDSKCTQGIDYLASTITGREMQAEQSSLLSKLFKR